MTEEYPDLEGARLGPLLTHVVRPRIRCCGRSWPAYGLFVISGVLLGSGGALLLAFSLDVSVLGTAAVLTTSVAIALLLAYGTRALTGRESFTFYHYQLSAIVGIALAAWLMELGALPYLDLLALAFAVTQGFGRIGCLMAGCCHGRPARGGVCYGREHADDGLPNELVGIPLLPVQALESLANLLLAAAATLLLLFGAPAGSALLVYLAGYASVRFGTELLRGDRRPGFAGLSQAQWISLTVLVVAAGLAIYLASGRALWAGVSMPAFALLLFGLPFSRATKARRACRALHALRAGWHQTEIAALAKELSHSQREDSAVWMKATSLGMRLSRSKPDGDQLELFALSHRGGHLDERTAQITARTLLTTSASPSGELLSGGAGIWHLLVRT